MSWDKELGAKMRKAGLPQDHIGIVIGEVAEQRQVADRTGFIRGYNRGYEDGFLKAELREIRKVGTPYIKLIDPNEYPVVFLTNPRRVRMIQIGDRVSKEIPVLKGSGKILKDLKKETITGTVMATQKVNGEVLGVLVQWPNKIKWEQVDHNLKHIPKPEPETQDPKKEE